MSASADVADMVAAVLDAPPTPEQAGVPWEIVEVERLRSAAIRVIEAEDAGEVTEAGARSMLRALATEAARTALSEQALDAVCDAIRGPDVPPLPPLDVELATARLRRTGYDRCPACRRDMPSAITLERWRRDHVAADETIARYYREEARRGR